MAQYKEQCVVNKIELLQLWNFGECDPNSFGVLLVVRKKLGMLLAQLTKARRVSLWPKSDFSATCPGPSPASKGGIAVRLPLASFSSNSCVHFTPIKIYDELVPFFDVASQVFYRIVSKYLSFNK